MSSASPVQLARNRLGVFVRLGYAPDSTEVIAARAALNAAKIEQRIRECADAGPPLTPADRTRLAELLLSGAA